MSFYFRARTAFLLYSSSSYFMGVIPHTESRLMRISFSIYGVYVLYLNACVFYDLSQR